MGALPAPSLLAAVILTACVTLSPAEASSHWSYEGKDGPDNWPGKCSGQKKQSPIDLGTSGITEHEFPSLWVINYDKQFNGTIKNNGHTIQINIMDRPHDIMLAGGGLNKLYVLEQIHFHWDSEHTVKGKRYPLEAHFVHYDKEKASLGEAAKSTGGIAVLGVLYEATGQTSSDIQILSDVQEVKYNAENKIKFRPKDLLPRDLTKFYRYYGSLTTPNCDESVIWTVIENTHPLSANQIRNFKQVKGINGSPLQSNYRPLQDQNNRIVYYQTSPLKEVQWTNSACSIKISLFLTAILLMILKYV